MSTIKSLTAVFTVLLVGLSCNKRPSSYSLDAEFSADNLRWHVSVLASDSLQGRGAGYDGERKAAEYIADHFKRSGLKPINSESDKEGYFQSFEFLTFGSDSIARLRSQNVAAILKGRELPNEYVVIGGHHDGQGMVGMSDLGRELAEDEVDSALLEADSIWNSAVDNAVSIAVILEMARIFNRTGYRPKRSIIFSTFSAEESGLDGSIHFANNPPVARESIKAMINLEKIVGDPDADFLYVSYSTSEVFEKVAAQMDSIYNIELVPFYSGMIANTDHYGFGLREIPAITMGTGSFIKVHTQLDHADRLDYDLLSSRARYILQYLLGVANFADNIEFTGDLSSLTGVTGGVPTKEELARVGFSGQNAFKVASVVKDSRGFRAGILPADIIVSVNGQPIAKQNFYQGLEDVVGEVEGKTELELIRNGKKRKVLME